MVYNLSHIYKQYIADGGVMSKNDFKNVCQDFNIHICNHLIHDAGCFDMGNNLSTIEVARRNRLYKNPAIDWNESLKYKEELIEKGEKLYDKETGEGTKWFIYNNDPHYCFFYWHRSRAKFKNKHIYSLIMTRGNHGVKTKLKQHLYENDTNYLKYRKLG